MRRRSRILIYGLPTLAISALAGAVLSIANSNRNADDILGMLLRPPPPTQTVVRAAAPPRTMRIGAAGIVEPSSQAINVGTAVAGIVEKIHVAPGGAVKRGDVLFVLEGSVAEAALQQKHRDLAVAVAQLAQTRKQVLALAAEVQKARGAMEAALAARDEAADMVRIAGRLREQNAMSGRERTRRSNQLRVANAQFNQAEASYRQALSNLALYQEPDGPAIAIARATVEQAKAAVVQAERTLMIRTVTAPITGTILQVNIRPGEHARSGENAEPLIVMGKITPMHVRVDIDESDISRWRPNADATARLRDRSGVPIPLTFVRREPLVIPKQSLTGALDERVDTRVMQVLYAAQTPDSRLLPGQQVDVLIELGPTERLRKLQATAQRNR